MPSIIEVPWPANFVAFVSKFNIVNIDVFSLIGISCVGNFNFYMGFMAMMGLPGMIVLWMAVTLWTSTAAMNRKVASMTESDKTLQREEAYRMLYHLADSDGEGGVSPLEFSRLLKVLGWTVNVKQAEKLVVAMNEGKPGSSFRDTRGMIVLHENIFVEVRSFCFSSIPSLTITACFKICRLTLLFFIFFLTLLFFIFLILFYSFYYSTSWREFWTMLSKRRSKKV